MNIKTNSHFKQFIRTNVLLLLFVCSVQSTWADEEIFKMSTTVSTTGTVSNGGKIDGFMEQS